MDLVRTSLIYAGTTASFAAGGAAIGSIVPVLGNAGGMAVVAIGGLGVAHEFVKNAEKACELNRLHEMNLSGTSHWNDAAGRKAIELIQDGSTSGRIEDKH